jgi:HAD superfamily hydrolase (TIGR01549 family)
LKKPDLSVILFDMDNTLVDMNMKHIENVLKKTFKALGKEFDYRLAEKFWFCSGRSYFGSTYLGVKDDDFWTAYRKFNTPEDSCKASRPFYDIDFIDDLKNDGYTTGIVTSAPEYMGKPVVEKLGEEKFNVVVYANAMHGFKHKPDPHGILHAIEELGSEPKDCAYVGDTPGDMEAAKRAGVFPIFIDRKTHSIKHSIDVPLKVTSLYCIGSYLGMKGY